MGRPTKRAAHKSHPYSKPLRVPLIHIRLRQLLDHNDLTVELNQIKSEPDGKHQLSYNKKNYQNRFTQSKVLRNATNMESTKSVEPFTCDALPYMWQLIFIYIDVQICGSVRCGNHKTTPATSLGVWNNKTGHESRTVPRSDPFRISTSGPSMTPRQGLFSRQVNPFHHHIGATRMGAFCGSVRRRLKDTLYLGTSILGPQNFQIVCIAFFTSTE
ncbi:hypothetical protein EVAR_67032_1 [Eumeta japonica]|uniref:Uncharacterized protein n=1 Tax=Eumeta variegata TaxID=151549 RepID=A0A4C2A0F5_EUMVA|nr:hypothetical protein EVAR_67032_1 [Eumeta japonica]